MRTWTDEQILEEFTAAHRALVQLVTNASEDDREPMGRVWQTIDEDSAGHYAAHFPVAGEMAARWPKDVTRE